MAEVWILIFMFTNGQVYASGPHDLATCISMADAQPVAAACVHKDRPRERGYERKAPAAAGAKAPDGGQP